MANVAEVGTAAVGCHLAAVALIGGPRQGGVPAARLDPIDADASVQGGQGGPGVLEVTVGRADHQCPEQEPDLAPAPLVALVEGDHRHEVLDGQLVGRAQGAVVLDLPPTGEGVQEVLQVEPPRGIAREPHAAVEPLCPAPLPALGTIAVIDLGGHR
eukprot:15445757-Alexandrium_andersonii.AAC.1